MPRRVSLALLPATALVVLLSACGGGDQAATPSAPASQPPAASSAPAESSPPSAPASEPASSPSESAAPDGGSKPSKAEIVAGLSTFYETKQNLSADKAQKFAVCMVDEMYDKAKPATLTALRDGDPTKADKSDAALIAKSGLKCQSALQ